MSKDYSNWQIVPHYSQVQFAKDIAGTDNLPNSNFVFHKNVEERTMKDYAQNSIIDKPFGNVLSTNALTTIPAAMEVARQSSADFEQAWSALSGMYANATDTGANAISFAKNTGITAFTAMYGATMTWSIIGGLLAAHVFAAPLAIIGIPSYLLYLPSVLGPIVGANLPFSMTLGTVGYTAFHYQYPWEALKSGLETIKSSALTLKDATVLTGFLLKGMMNKTIETVEDVQKFVNDYINEGKVDFIKLLSKVVLVQTEVEEGFIKIDKKVVKLVEAADEKVKDAVETVKDFADEIAEFVVIGKEKAVSAKEKLIEEAVDLKAIIDEVSKEVDEAEVEEGEAISVAADELKKADIVEGLKVKAGEILEIDDEIDEMLGAAKETVDSVKEAAEAKCEKAEGYLTTAWNALPNTGFSSWWYGSSAPAETTDSDSLEISTTGDLNDAGTVEVGA